MNLSIHRNLVCSLLHQTLHSILDNHRWAMEIIFKEISFKERCNWRSYWNHNHSPSLYVDDHLWDVGSCCLAHCTFHHRSLHIQVLKQFSLALNMINITDIKLGILQSFVETTTNPCFSSRYACWRGLHHEPCIFLLKKPVCFDLKGDVQQSAKSRKFLNGKGEGAPYRLLLMSLQHYRCIHLKASPRTLSQSCPSGLRSSPDSSTSWPQTSLWPLPAKFTFTFKF